MEESDHSPHIKGVVIISLPPPDNPSLGKTITAFTLTDDDHHHYSQQQQQQIQQSPTQQSPPPPPQTPQTQFTPSTLFLGTPRKLLAFACVSLFAIALYSSVFSDTLQEFKNSNDNDRKPQSFIFPLYHKFGIHEVLQRDLLHKLSRFVYKEDNFVGPIGDNLIAPRRINKLASSSAAAIDGSSIFPARGNLFPDGLYFTYILVGNPPSPYYLDIDTGSDLTWIQCDAPCISCAKGANALYKPRRGNVVPPRDSLCMEVQKNQKAGYCETCQQCDYEIEYADHSSSMGVLARDEFHLMIANGSLTKQSFIFGCAYDQQGLLLNTLMKTDGILGLSKAKVSLPSQLASQGIINNVIGHCLTNDIGGGGYMFLGDDFVPRWGMTWVSMLNSPSMGVYHTQIAKVSYGRSALSLAMQDGGVRRVVFDSGSSYTYFTKEAYAEVVASLKEVTSLGLTQDMSDPTLPFCWRAKYPIRSVADVKRFFKTITFEFGSKWRIISTKFRISPEGYLIISDRGNVCLGILDGSKVHDGSAIILGDITLRGQLVIFDNVNKKIGWMASDCVKPMRYESLPFFDDKAV